MIRRGGDCQSVALMSMMTRLAMMRMMRMAVVLV